MGITNVSRCLAATLSAVILPIHTAHALDLSQYRWKHRILVLFAPAASHESYRVFHERLTQRSGDVLDRDLIVFRVFEDDEAKDLRGRFKPKLGEFTLILIGKDGVIKLRKENDTDLQDIFDLIDSMPMRKAEMLTQSRHGRGLDAY